MSENHATVDIHDYVITSFKLLVIGFITVVIFYLPNSIDPGVCFDSEDFQFGRFASVYISKTYLHMTPGIPSKSAREKGGFEVVVYLQQDFNLGAYKINDARRKCRRCVGKLT